MSTDYHQLLQKFNNFKAFVAEHAKNEKAIQEYQHMTDDQFLLTGFLLLVPNKAPESLDKLVDMMVQKIQLNSEHRDKFKRYIECFIEYLDQLNTPDFRKEVVKRNLEEQGIKLAEK